MGDSPSIPNDDQLAWDLLVRPVPREDDGRRVQGVHPDAHLLHPCPPEDYVKVRLLGKHHDVLGRLAANAGVGSKGWWRLASARTKVGELARVNRAYRMGQEPRLTSPV